MASLQSDAGVGGLTHVGVLLLCRCDLTLHDLIRPHLNRVVRVKSFALATNGCQVKVVGHSVVQSCKSSCVGKSNTTLEWFLEMQYLFGLPGLLSSARLRLSL